MEALAMGVNADFIKSADYAGFVLDIGHASGKATVPPANHCEK
jgi:hypothetical protein